MKFISNQDTLSKHLNALKRIINNKSGLPILSNIYISAEKGKLNMVATDLELGIKSWIGTDVKKSGNTTVPAKELSEFVNTVREDKINAELQGTKFMVSTEANSTTCNTIRPDEYPTPPSPEKDDKPLFLLTPEQVNLVHQRVSFATANDDIKPVMTGILIELEQKNATFVGADGLRLSRQNVELVSPANVDKEATAPVEILVSARAFGELSAIVSEFAEDDSQNLVEVYMLEKLNQVVFKFNGIELSARVIDGVYPRYKAVIPEEHRTRSVFAKDDLQNSLKIVNIIARNIFGNKVEFQIDAKSGTIQLSATQAELGSNQSTFNAKIEGDDIHMAFSAKFVGDFLSHISAQEIVLETTTPEQAGVFRIKDDEDFLHLIMPMRL